METKKPLRSEPVSTAASPDFADDWTAVAEFRNLFPHYKSESALRHEIAEAEENGLLEAGAILRVGGRLFLSPNRYFAHWKKRSDALAQQPDQQSDPQLELDLTTKES